MDAASFTYDNKIITVTHDMSLHITNCLPEDDRSDFQKVFLLNGNDDNKFYFLELMHIIFTKLISNVPDALCFKLYLYKIPSCMIPHKFAKDAFKILKPMILHHKESRYTYERYFAGKKEEDEDEEEEDEEKEEKEDKEKEEKPTRSIFDLSYSDEEEYKDIERKRRE